MKKFDPQKTPKERYKICKSCMLFIKLTKQCRSCWCFMNLKTKIKEARCPVYKW